MNVTAWSNGLEVTGDGTGIVSHAGLGLLRRLADKTEVTAGFSRALWSGRVLGHDRGRVLADLACVIVGGARAISDFRVLADQKEAFGQVASVPTAYRALEEIADGGERTARKLAAAVNTARRRAWTQIVARHGKLPGVRVADKILEGVTCIRLDVTVTFAHSDKELAEANFKGYGLLTELRGCLCSSGGGLRLAPLRSLFMTGLGDLHRDMADLVVPRAGLLQATGGPWDPYRLIDPWGEVVGPVTVYLRDLLGVQVDLVLVAVQTETDRALSRTAVQIVMNKVRIFWATGRSTSSSYFGAQA